MPPKKQEPSKKTEIKKKEKIVEDKTFGMKNKKGAKQQKFIQQVQQQVSQMGKSTKQLTQQEKERLERTAEKDQKKKAAEELNTLFKPVEQKVGKGTDPKSVLCAFFKQGLCTKGDKCKFSHDLSIGRKAEKRSLYDDQRDDEDTMDNWDEEKLEEVVKTKHGESDSSKPRTEIICKFFLEAVETSKYGWFWNCPNGEACKYRHALPPGFVLKKDQVKENKDDEISLEDLIEKERASLSSKDLIRVTLESFLVWKEAKRKQRIQTTLTAIEKKKNNFAAGKMFGISGREIFEFNPELVKGDDDEADEDEYLRESSEEEEDESGVREVDLAMFSEQLQQQQQHQSSASADSSASNGLSKFAQPSTSKNSVNSSDYLKHNGTTNRSEVGAVGADDEDDGDDTNIDENLFDGEDLDLVEEELENLELYD